MLRMVSSYILWTLLGVFQKISQVFLLDLMNNISVNNVYIKYIFIYPCSKSKLCLFQHSMIFPWVTDLKFNDFSMSNWFKIQWFFHDFFNFTNFKNFSWNSMTFPWSWNRSEFQWFFKSCGNPGYVNIGPVNGLASSGVYHPYCNRIRLDLIACSWHPLLDWLFVQQLLQNDIKEKT